MIPYYEVSNTTQVMVVTKVVIPRELGCSYQFGSPSPVATTECQLQHSRAKDGCEICTRAGKDIWKKQPPRYNLKRKMKSVDLKHPFVSDNNNTSTGYISSMGILIRIVEGKSISETVL